MSLTLYAHPFSSYCQKVLVAFWENEVPFAYRHLEEPGAGEELGALWPLGRFPVLVDDGRTVAEISAGDDNWISLISRSGRNIPVRNGTRLRPGDVVLTQADSDGDGSLESQFEGAD